MAPKAYWHESTLLEPSNFMKAAPPDWQLPAGVTRGLWDYVHDPHIANHYDAYLAHSSLFRADLAFVERHCPQPGRLIDLGCGTGRLLIHLARRGYPVVGVDLSEEMLKVARARAREASVEVTLLKATLVQLDALQDQSFSYAACLFSTLGMVNGPEERRRVVAHTYRLLRPGGTFILHVHNRWFNFWDPQGRLWLLKDLFRSLAGRPEAGDRPMPPHQGIGELSLHHFTRREAKALLKQAGFRLREVYPLSLRTDGRLLYPYWFRWLRSYGYLLAAQRA
ncbi:MAG: class I SAM-dependent methyltransferase [Gemmataceae bacterium]